MSGRVTPAVASAVIESLARNIRFHRTRLGLSLPVLARRAGISHAMVKNLERRRANPPVVILLRLANALAVSLSQLVDGSGAASHYDDPEAMAAALHPRVRSLRRRRGWTRLQFCEIAGISRGTLHYLETGSIAAGTTMIERVARAFGLSFVELVEMTESPVIAIARATREKGSRMERLLLDHSRPTSVEVSTCHLTGRQRIATTPRGGEATEVVYVIDGAVHLAINGERHTLGAGDAVLFDAANACTFSTQPARTATFLRVALVPKKR